VRYSSSQARPFILPLSTKISHQYAWHARKKYVMKIIDFLSKKFFDHPLLTASYALLQTTEYPLCFIIFNLRLFRL